MGLNDRHGPLSTPAHSSSDGGGSPGRYGGFGWFVTGANIPPTASVEAGWLTTARSDAGQSAAFCAAHPKAPTALNILRRPVSDGNQRISPCRPGDALKYRSAPRPWRGDLSAGPAQCRVL